MILAGGKGTRMKQDFAKVLALVAGKSMIERVLDVVNNFVDKPVVVVGFDREKVMAEVGDRAIFAIQEAQKGTGHAVLCAKEKFNGFSGSIIVLYGDHPLVSGETIKKLFELREKNSSEVAMLTTKVSDFEDWRARFFSFGRIIRGNSGKIEGIVELKNATEEQKQILEVNPGYYCFDSVWLWDNIEKLSDQNNQKEFLLTDLIAICVAEGKEIATETVEPIECIGINTPEELLEAERIINNK